MLADLVLHQPAEPVERPGEDRVPDLGRARGVRAHDPAVAVAPLRRRRASAWSIGEKAGQPI